MWLGGLGTVLQTERSPVRFPIRANAQVAGQVLWSGVCERQMIDVYFTHHCLSLSLSPSLPLSLKINYKKYKSMTAQDCHTENSIASSWSKRGCVPFFQVPNLIKCLHLIIQKPEVELRHGMRNRTGWKSRGLVLLGPGPA